MIQLHFNQVQVTVADGQAPDGSQVKLLIVTDPQSGLQAVIPFDPDAARTVGAQLGGVTVARGNGAAPLPPDFEQRVRRLGR